LLHAGQEHLIEKFVSGKSEIFHFFHFSLVCSFALLRGPYNHFRSMINPDRLPLTSAYLMSTAATLYFALEVSCDIDAKLFSKENPFFSSPNYA
jgi:Got1/Sft2-like family